MFGKILFLFTCVTLLWGCNSVPPEIRALCLRDDIGNYVIKWETDPQMEGTLKLYVSDHPDSFDTAMPAGYANISEGVSTYITNDNTTRKYFQLVFNNRYMKTVGARTVVMDSVQNLRDLGGYAAGRKKTTRWGKFFRSGQLSALSEWDSIRLDNLGIRTIIDLRTDSEAAVSPTQYTKARIIRIPVSIGRGYDIPERIQEGRMRKGDAMLYMQDQYLQFVTDNTEQFAKAFEPLLDEANYPILFNCTFGKDRTGFMAAMLLAALGVSEETILKDYMASSEYIDLSQLAYLARDLSTDAQESITVLLSVHESLMDLALQKIRKEYGSVDKYLTKGLRLDEKKREKLKDILLY